MEGKKIDVVLGHHPKGKAFSTFYQVIGMQAEINEIQGVPINVAEKLIYSRATEVERSVAGSNHQRVYDAAKLLNIPMMTAHTVADNHVVKFLQNSINALKPRYLNDIMTFLNDIPEYKYAKTFGNGPSILCGSGNSKCGKVFEPEVEPMNGQHILCPFCGVTYSYSGSCWKETRMNEVMKKENPFASPITAIARKIGSITWRMPFLPQICAPVGKSGPFTNCMRSSTVHSSRCCT